MMPNMDPKSLKKMMDRMGIKTEEIDANRVIIEGKEVDIVIDQPQITSIEAQGTKSFQISGIISERGKGRVEISEDDVKMVMEKAGVGDSERARKALEDANGDIAAAILSLRQGA